MDNNLLNRFAKKATDLWLSEKFDEAIKYYEKVYPFLDPDHGYTTTFLGQYAITLDSIGKTEYATAMFIESINSALKSDTKESIIVHLSRLALGEHLFKHKEYEAAYEAVLPSLEIESEDKWVLLFLVASIYHKQGKIKEYEQVIIELMELAPKGEFESITKLKELIEN